jgi:hypothetical protein
LPVVSFPHESTEEPELLSHWLPPPALVRFPRPMATEAKTGERRHQRISLPNGMVVTWYGGGDQQESRVKTLSLGGLFLSGRAKPVGTELKLIFQVPDGMVFADAIVRNNVPGEGMGVEFTKINPQDRALLERLLNRLLR